MLALLKPCFGYKCTLLSVALAEVDNRLLFAVDINGISAVFIAENRIQCNASAGELEFERGF